MLASRAPILFGYLSIRGSWNHRLSPLPLDATRSVIIKIENPRPFDFAQGRLCLSKRPRQGRGARTAETDYCFAAVVVTMFPEFVEISNADWSPSTITKLMVDVL
jgi:hypothetical protein